MISGIANFVLRGFQALFAIVVIGLSVTLIRGHHWGSLPWQLGFACFAGGLAFVAALIGLAGSFISLLEGMVGLIIDGVVAVINILGGIIMAVKLDGVKCENKGSVDNGIKIVENELFNGGTRNGVTWVEYQYQENEKKYVDVVLGHCREVQADTVFMFLTAVVFLVSGVLLFLRARKGY
ncbi:hypothetical protein NX059_005697 [Plenodomus lindquistii]|nr:hypothetical protein NX059_005697 [Plenodomus lindquistii]